MHRLLQHVSYLALLGGFVLSP